MFKDFEGRYKYQIMVHHVTGTWLITNRPNSHGLEGYRVWSRVILAQTAEMCFWKKKRDSPRPSEIIVTVTVAWGLNMHIAENMSVFLSHTPYIRWQRHPLSWRTSVWKPRNMSMEASIVDLFSMFSSALCTVFMIGVYCTYKHLSSC